jgi:hypothetical protein
VLRHGIDQQVQRSSAGSTPHDRITILQICSSHSSPLHRPRQSALGYPAFAAKWSPTHSLQRHPPLIHEPMPLRSTRWGGPIPIKHRIRGIQIPIVNAAPPTSPSRGFLPWRFAYAGPGARRATCIGPPSANLHRCGRHDVEPIAAVNIYIRAGVSMSECPEQISKRTGARIARFWAWVPVRTAELCVSLSAFATGRRTL